jgi:glycosyltransferase involved in cell wall biosynthesis
MPALLPENNKSSHQEQTEARKVSVCIVSHNGYGAISGMRGGHVGGVERQTSLLALWLAAHGHKVSILTWNEGGPDEEVIAGVRAIKICRKNAGLPGLRFFHPKWSGLLAALRKANADIYYQNCGGCVTGQLAIWCRLHGKPFVFSLASDADCDPNLPELRMRRERILYRYGLRHASRRVAQTATQSKRLAEHFRVNSEIIPMPAPDPQTTVTTSTERTLGRIVWVGRVCRVKRPDLLLDIAEKCPDLGFDIAGPVYDDEYSRSVARRATMIPNVRMLGTVPREGIATLYRSASLLCCTSDYEGFPNTFLEAWSHGLPIVSTVDPDGLIANRKLGRVGRNPTSLVAGIRELLENPACFTETSSRAREYYLRHHTMEAVMPRFEQMFINLVHDKVITIE